MGKASKVKCDYRDTSEMLDLIQTLKDVADNKYFTLVAQKDSFRRFGESFVDFFRLLSFTKEEHPLISNNNPNIGIVVVTIEGSFLGQFNNSIIRLAMSEAAKTGGQVQFIGVGDKCVDQLKAHTANLKTFTGLEITGHYETSVAIKDYLVDEIMNDRLGKVMIAHSWPKNFETQKPRLNKLLPAEDLVTKQALFASEFEKMIEESNTTDLIGFVVNLWITTRIYEILVDTTIASAAAQSNFLEERVEDMKKEKKKVLMKFRKARKEDIDKSLRETFTARSMTVKN